MMVENHKEELKHKDKVIGQKVEEIKKYVLREEEYKLELTGPHDQLQVEGEGGGTLQDQLIPSPEINGTHEEQRVQQEEGT